MANLNPEERSRFAALAASWWDPDGSSRTLHDINPCRLAYVGEGLDLNGLRVADIGCGGGILSVALARAGARVTAVDATPELIDVAIGHAAGLALSIDFRVQLSAELAAAEPAAYDIVTCMELIEHVPDATALIGDCAALLKPGGRLIVSTLNRTPAAWALGIVAAEYVLDLVPRGTHDYAQFLRPAELAAAARLHGLEVMDISAMRYNPLTRRARLGGAPQVNYLARLQRPAPG